MRLLQCLSRHIYRFRRAESQTLSSVSNFTSRSWDGTCCLDIGLRHVQITHVGSKV